jgi:hypothetical protein
MSFTVMPKRSWKGGEQYVLPRQTTPRDLSPAFIVLSYFENRHPVPPEFSMLLTEYKREAVTQIFNINVVKFYWIDKKLVEISKSGVNTVSEKGMSSNGAHK